VSEAPRRGRDYSPAGPSNAAAVAAGLANAAWFMADIDPARLRELQQRSNGRAALDTLLWLALLAGIGTVAWQTAWSWWSIPLFFIYGALYDGGGSSRRHECQHGTAFRTAWLNDAVDRLTAFLMISSPTASKWSHFRHHTDTIIVGRDLEIRMHRPTTVGEMLWKLTAIPTAPLKPVTIVKQAFGHIDAVTAEFVPPSERRKVVMESRLTIAGYACVIAWCFAVQSIMPLMLIGLPAIYGSWLTVFFSIIQHSGMREDVTDHRLNSRTIYMDPVWRFVYVNMNYHIEHHMFPTVPYRSLPALHAEIKDQLPPTLPNVRSRVREVIDTIRRMQRDPNYELPLELPPVRNASRHRLGTEFNLPPERLADGTIDCGALESLSIGELRAFTIDGHEYVLGRLDASTVVIADGQCTHQNASLADGVLVEGCFECPKHNARFDARTGACRRMPAKIPLNVYDVTIRNGRIITSLSRKAD